VLVSYTILNCNTYQLLESPVYPLPLNRLVVTVATAAENATKGVIIMVILITSIATGIAGEEPARHCDAWLYWIKEDNKYRR
jgi:hypothetical protein